MRRRIAVSLAVMAAAASVAAGCGGSGEGSPIREGEAQDAVAAVFDRPMVDNVITGPDATTDHIAGSFTGGNSQEHLVGVVFTQPKETRVLTGATRAASLSGPGRTIIIREKNVVLLYTRRAYMPDRTARLRRTLRDLAAKASS